MSEKSINAVRAVHECKKCGAANNIRARTVLFRCWQCDELHDFREKKGKQDAS